MAKRESSIATPLAHLVGPGKLKVINEQLAFSTQKGEVIRLNPESLTTVMCYGEVGITDRAFQLLFKHNIEVAWLTPAGNRCKGRLVRSDPSSTVLRMAQHRTLAQPEPQLQIARAIVQGKIDSQLEALRHYQRHGHKSTAAIRTQLQDAHKSCDTADSLDQLRGLEGSSSAAWFRFFGELLCEPWVFEQRARRPPPDPVNALLSLGYTWLLTKAIARCEAKGFEIQLGALHAYRAGRPSLACDVIEPLRVPAVDRWVIPLLNRATIKLEDFEKENEGFRLQPSIFPTILQSWEQHWLDRKLEAMLLAWLDQIEAFCRQCANLPESDGSN